ncbi:hypothetical protein C8Q79DRAFT_590614 [Trametes meyenii]|nr:hypothetical protein C8Q79DRAFT_590614 [Trametes meyenii]
MTWPGLRRRFGVSCIIAPLVAIPPTRRSPGLLIWATPVVGSSSGAPHRGPPHPPIPLVNMPGSHPARIVRYAIVVRSAVDQHVPTPRTETRRTALLRTTDKPNIWQSESLSFPRK